MVLGRKEGTHVFVQWERLIPDALCIHVIMYLYLIANQKTTL